MVFFGSRVSEVPHPDSDVDLVIVSEDFTGVRSRHRARGFRDIWHLDYPVDFLCFTPEEVEELKEEPTVVREALRQGIEIE
jgi:predicted nucleotidyltransferase